MSKLDERLHEKGDAINTVIKLGYTVTYHGTVVKEAYGTRLEDEDEADIVCLYAFDPAEIKVHARVIEDKAIAASFTNILRRPL